MNFSTDLFLEYKRRPGRAALARLLERHQDAVYTLCHQVLRHPQDAEDACQEVLLEVSRQVGAIEEPSKFAGWLYRTALHTALDVKRKRGRQRVRDAGASRAPVAGSKPPEAAEALHQGLAGLDDTSRMLVVEHYFARRPLRELAAESGCSEVAVWKRIQTARERLKKALGSAAVSALEGISNVPAPAGLLQKALGFSGGLAMAVKGGIKVAIVAPLLLLAGTGTVLLVRRSEPPPAPPPRAEVRKPATAPVVPPVPTIVPAAVAQAAAPAKRPEARPRKPYPYRDLSGEWPPAAVRTWSILQSKKVTIDETNIGLRAMLQTFGELTGLSLLPAPGLDQERMSMKAQEIVADGCLRLLLQTRGLNYEILPDGSVRVDWADRVQGGYEKVAGAPAVASYELQQIREELDKGWDGMGRPDPSPAFDTLLRTKRIAPNPGETTLEQEIDRLRKLGVQVHLGVDGATVEAIRRRDAILKRPFVQDVAERSIEDHLQDLARAQGLVAVSVQGVVHFTGERHAADLRSRADEARRESERFLENLQKPVEPSPASDVQSFLDSIGRSHGLPVLPGEDVWNSPATLSLPAGTTLRQALDQLKAHGFRWALLDGKIYIVK